MIAGVISLAITFWLVVGAVIIANGYFVYQVRMARYRVMQSLADKGQPVPVELLGGNVRQAHVGLLRGGIILLCLGAALGGFLWAMTAQSWFNGPVAVGWLPAVALFPVLLGLALIVSALLDRRRPQ